MRMRAPSSLRKIRLSSDWANPFERESGIDGRMVTDASSDKVDTDEADEVIDAIAKTVAELTSQQDGFIRQQVIEQLMRQIMNYDGEFAVNSRPLQSAT